MNRLNSNFLTADSTFLTGAGTVFNLAGVYYRYNSSSTPSKADAKAVYMDWAMIGQDLRDAMAAFEEEEQMNFSFMDEGQSERILSRT